MGPILPTYPALLLLDLAALHFNFSLMYRLICGLAVLNYSRQGFARSLIEIGYFLPIHTAEKSVE